ncbi:hypothetical protein PR048_013026 [Dryococelus australis]|uniref:Uncharacterized protein n=1 Tax=Dryococelus australis TaxID=614101 RepID=A0ABQ9HR10_9NEOP|nr:hypothetical protein PR048_013026 [Dryococelus australis]
MEQTGKGTFEEKATIIKGMTKQKCHIEIECPHALTTYNHFMRGVDLLDGLISYYRIGIQSKKYYTLFFYFTDIV